MSLLIELHFQEGQYIAVEPRTGMFGEGDSSAEATRDVMDSLHAHRRDLAAHRGRLSRHLASQLTFLEQSAKDEDE